MWYLSRGLKIATPAKGQTSKDEEFENAKTKISRGESDQWMDRFSECWVAIVVIAMLVARCS